MAIQLRAVADGVESGDVVQLTVPATTLANDLIVVLCGSNVAGQTFATPDGWTAVLAQVGGDQNSAVFTRYALESDAGAVLTFPITPGDSGGSKQVGSIAVFHSDTPSMVAQVGASASAGETVSGTTHTAPSITVAALPAVLASAVCVKGSTVSSLTPPSGFTSAVDTFAAGTNTIGTAIAYKDAPATGSQSGGAWTANISNLNASMFTWEMTETDAPAAPELLRPVLRRWNGVAWTLVPTP